jgi:hypothetical protein
MFSRLAAWMQASQPPPPAGGFAELAPVAALALLVVTGVGVGPGLTSAEVTGLAAVGGGAVSTGAIVTGPGEVGGGVAVVAAIRGG